MSRLGCYILSAGYLPFMFKQSMYRQPCALQVGNKAAALLMERMGREVAKCG